MLVNLRKANNSVYNEILLEILWKRCESEEDKVLVSLIANLHAKNSMEYEGGTYYPWKGSDAGQ